MLVTPLILSPNKKMCLSMHQATNMLRPMVMVHGNTHVSITWACLLADSRLQRVHSLTYILIRSLIAEAPVPQPSSSSPPRLGPPYLFLFPPTHSCPFFYISFYLVETPVATTVYYILKANACIGICFQPGYSKI